MHRVCMFLGDSPRIQIVRSFGSVDRRPRRAVRDAGVRRDPIATL